MAASVAVMALLALTLSKVTDASIYQEVHGKGFCTPSTGSEYSYILKRNVDNHKLCSEACDNVNLNHREETEHHYRAFAQNRRAADGIPKDSCLCYYDYGHVPDVDGMEGWSKYDAGDGEGRVDAPDGYSDGVLCYEILVDEAVSSVQRNVVLLTHFASDQFVKLCV